MKKHSGFSQSIFIITIFSLIFIGGPVNVSALISEPDSILYGTVSANQKVYTTGKITLKFSGKTLVESEIADDTGANRYIIRIPMDGSNPRNPDAVRFGEVAQIYFNTSGYQLGQITIGEKGKASELNFIIPDTDNDGLSDADELEAQTNKDNPDSDGDGLLDGWEKMYGFDPVDTDNSQQDGDQDGLTNLQEQAHGTNPLLADTDNDGCEDGIELAGRRNPLVFDPFGDINLDCVIDLKDLILTLEIMTKLSDCPETGYKADVNNDGKIGHAEAVFILQIIADLRRVGIK